MNLWRVLQAAIFLGFLAGNIHFQWGIEGIATPVMGGMLAYYVSVVLAAVIDRFRVRQSAAQAPKASDR